ncbi:AarF/ABC1/UbiB kinase family protein [Nevskia sp.]|uniref:ABC1 kinase family protein n=1 Tax=Nevskia sp. TaxID=1929292 RepID=UPI00260142C4|nr:AarF/ABC1/UbiB kinase family protein [Nevskia sp.]
MDSDSTSKPPEKSPHKSSLSSLKTSPFERNIALTKLGFGAGTKIVAHSLMNIFRGEVEKTDANREFYRKQATVLADELGKLKGSVMKAGQMMSLFGQYFLPEEAVDVLASLQDDTPPVDWKVVGPALERSLGRKRLSELEVDPDPIAAASLGQAHRARRKSDGLELVVKIQYPGVADSIDSDIRTLSRLLSMTRLAPKELDLAPTFAEVREMLKREVDYRAECQFTEDFGRRLAGDSRFVVPQVLRDYSSDAVLTTTYERGVAVRDPAVLSLSAARRNHFGSAFLDLFLEEFFDWGLVQSDPNFGNYRFRIGERPEDDKIVLLDFGATREFERGFINQYAQLVAGACLRDRRQTLEGAVGIGLMQAGFPAEVQNAFAEMCELIVEPFNRADDPLTLPELRNARGEYRWGASKLPMRAANVAARNALSRYFRVPPREIVFLHRRLGGVFIMLATLDVELNARAALFRTLSIKDAD